jgi:hypothetical protein
MQRTDCETLLYKYCCYLLTAIERTTTAGTLWNAVHDMSHATSAKIHLSVRWYILSEKYYANVERNLGRYVITYSVTYVT